MYFLMVFLPRPRAGKLALRALPVWPVLLQLLHRGGSVFKKKF
jgi:hypothetical protein